MRKWIKKLANIVLAIILIAVSVNMFLGPHNIAAGGITGLAIILEALMDLDRSLFIMIANVLILIITLIFLGREVFFNTVIGSLLLPVIIGLVPHVMLVSDVTLSMVVGSVFFGIAVAILYRNNASSGGTSIPPLILHKYFKLNTSVGLFITDGVVVLFSLIIFNVESFFYAIFSIFITSAAMNYIQTGVNKKKTALIISDRYEEIVQEIFEKIDRGVTVIPVIGAHERTERRMLMVTLESRSYKELISIVNRYDPKAFMTGSTVSDVHGEGFTYESGSI